MSEPQPSCYLPPPAPAGAGGATPSDSAVVVAHLQLTGLRAGMAALDVGCGSGAVTRLMSTIVGPSRVTGVDGCPAQVAVARTLAATAGIEIEFLAGAPTALPLPAASFDYSWARCVVAAQAQPARALAELVRVTRPGGSVVVGELAGLLTSLAPHAPALQRELRQALRLLEAGDPDLGPARMLAGWCAQAGLGRIRVQALPYQVRMSEEPEGALSRWCAHLARETQRLAAQTGEQARWAQLRADLLAQLHRPDRVYEATLILVRGTVLEPTRAEG